MKSVYFFIAFCFSIGTFAQPIDLSWPFGYEEFQGVDGFGQGIIHFEKDGSTWVEQSDLGMNFEGTVAFVTDTFGQLLLYSNGCEIRKADGTLLADGLNPSPVAGKVCPNKGYIVPRGAMFLPMPAVPMQLDSFILFHLNFDYTPDGEPRNKSLYTTEVNLKNGTVTNKNTVIEDGFIESFSGVRHGNGRDWWIIAPQLNRNIYHTWLLTPDGLIRQPSQTVGERFDCGRPGSCAFSLIGDKFARTHNCKTQVFDFDRCSGQLSFKHKFNRTNIPFGGGGVAFTHDSEKLIITGSNMSILEADLTQANPSLDTTASWWNYNLAGTTTGMMQYGPNGKIYINGMGRLRNYGAITNPFSVSDSLLFNQTELTLPIISVRTLPNLPNFRLYDWQGSICDTLGINGTSSLVEHSSEEKIKLNIYPNPSSDFIYFDHIAEKKYHYIILNSNGKKVSIGNQIPRVLDISFWSSGLYTVLLFSEDGYEISGRFVRL